MAVPIANLFAGVKGDTNNSTGADVATTINAVIDSQNTINTTIEQLAAASASATAAAASAATATGAAGIITGDKFKSNQFESDKKNNSERYAASGFVHMGKGYTPSVIDRVNEGMWMYQAGSTFETKSLYLGVNTGGIGNSKTDRPVINMAGMITELKLLGTSNAVFNCAIKFPPAPDGTVTYESTTGAVVNFLTDTDPKYNNVASTVAEAVGRAHEGMLKNGDFRLGDVEYSQAGTTWNADQTVSIADSGFLASSGTTFINVVAGDVLDVTIVGKGKHYIELSWTGSGNESIWTQEILGGTSFRESKYKVTVPTGDPNDDGTLQVILRGRNNNDTVVKSSSVRHDTNTVVTERVDMFGLEGFLEIVDTTKKFIFDRGLIQSQSTAMGSTGLATVVSTRALSYFAAYEGDILSRGREYNFFDAVAADQLKIVQDGDNLHNMYFIDGNWYQWRIRQRTIAGLGNGDWINTDTTTGNNLFYSAVDSLAPQGSLDVQPQFARTGGVADYDEVFTKFPSYIREGQTGLTGLYVTRNTTRNDDKGAFGHCYFLVLGTVPRLNQGAYHPSFNPFGTAGFYSDSGTNQWRLEWDDALSKNPASMAECFSVGDTNVSGNMPPFVGRGTSHTDGDIASASSSRPDGKFFDAIYNGGLGGAIDSRLSAWDMSSPKDASIVDSKVKNGSYRGLEKIKRTLLASAGFVTSQVPADNRRILMYAGNLFNLGGTFTAPCGGYIVDGAGAIHPIRNYSYSVATNQTSLTMDLPNGVTNNTADHSLLPLVDTGISMSGRFAQTDVVGVPSVLLADDDLRGGWLGAWIPVIPDGGAKDFPLVRKQLEKLTTPFSANSGATWTNYSSWSSIATFDDVKNHWVNIAFTAATVVLVTYESFAKQTKPVANKVVHGGESGLNKALHITNSSATTRGCFLLESLLGKVGSAVGSFVDSDIAYLLRATLGSSGSLVTSINSPVEHETIRLTDSNNSPAVKSLNYQIEDSEQVSLAYAYEEMIWDLTADNGNDFTNRADTTATATTVGVIYHVTGLKNLGYWRCLVVSSASFENGAWSEVDGKLIWESGVAFFERWNGTGWGNADSPLTVNDNQVNVTDDNGKSILAGTAELSIPYGWRKNNV